MVYQPTIGLHRDVAEIDFVSMYPGIMVRFNISPEVPRAGIEFDKLRATPEPAPGEPGIVPLTLAPLLNKRLALKSALLTLNKYDCRRPVYQGAGQRREVAAGDLLRLPGIQECPLWAHRGP